MITIKEQTNKQCTGIGANGTTREREKDNCRQVKSKLIETKSD